MHRGFACFMMFLSILLIVPAVFTIIQAITESSLFLACLGLLLILLLFPMTAFFFRSLGDAYDVRWDETGITGPSTTSLYTFRVRKRRITILWDDVVDLGQTVNESLYVQSKTRERILWSRYHNGHDVLENLIMDVLEARSGGDFSSKALIPLIPPGRGKVDWHRP